MNARRLVTPFFVIIHVVALHALVAWFRGPGQAPEAAAQSADAEPAAGIAMATAPEAEPPPQADPTPALLEPTARPGALALDRVYEADGRLYAELGHGWTAELTTDVALQKASTNALNRARVPFGAVVVVDVKTGDVLAMADRYDEKHASAPSLDPKGPPHLALRAIAPAASVFKIVTAAALLEAGVKPDKGFGYHTAMRKLQAEHLEKPGDGAPKADLLEALAASNNGYFARLANEHLDRDTLDAVVRRFGFNRVVPFPLLTEASTARVPRGALERSRMAAGFWHTRMTPLHGALIAAAVAADGAMPVPQLVRQLHAPDGRLVPAPARPPFARVMEQAHARQVRKGLVQTVTNGTGRRAFRKWPRALAGVQVAGKTGSLAKRDPYTSYTWFVGYAPADDPQIAIAVLAGNGELWWQRATDVASAVLEDHFTRLAKSKEAAKESAKEAGRARP